MKDCTTCKYGFVDEQFGIPMCHHPLRFSKDCVDFNMHEEKEEPKKATDIVGKKLPEGLEEAAWKYSPDLPSYNIGGGYLPPRSRDDLRTAFKAGAEWVKAKMMEEAVEGKIAERVQGKLYARYQIPNTMGVEFGDKVRVIIIKEEQK